MNLGYDKDLFKKNNEIYERGFYRNGIHEETGLPRDRRGYNILGYDKYGYDEDGFDKIGYDRNGLDLNGFDINGLHFITGTIRNEYGKTKYDLCYYYEEDVIEKYGYDEDGFDIIGYDRNGLDLNGFDTDGWNKEGIFKYTGTKYDRRGYDKEGYDVDGYNEYGFNKEGINRQTGEKVDIYGYNFKGEKIINFKLLEKETHFSFNRIEEFKESIVGVLKIAKCINMDQEITDKEIVLEALKSFKNQDKEDYGYIDECIGFFYEDKEIMLEVLKQDIYPNEDFEDLIGDELLEDKEFMLEVEKEKEKKLKKKEETHIIGEVEEIISDRKMEDINKVSTEIRKNSDKNIADKPIQYGE